MTKRYYYNDPLAAAWMAKHFGMDFQIHSSDTHGNFKDHLMDIGVIQIRRHIEASATDKYYIHPESESVLEPKDKDIALWKGDLGRIIENNTDIGWAFYVLEMNCSRRMLLSFRDLEEHPEIIYRNHLPFFWPKVEYE